MYLFLAALSLSLQAAPPSVHPPAAVATETEAQAASARFVAAFNAPGSMRDFIAGNFTQVSLARENVERRSMGFDRLKAAAGGFVVVDTKPQGERMVELIVATRNDRRFAKVVLFTSRQEQGKIADIFILDARDPERAAADAFPAAKASDQDIVRLALRRLDNLAEEDRFSGAVLVAHRGKVLVREARGLADQSWRVPNRPSTRFHIASMGKMWTAVAVLRLAEQRKLSLDDKLARWVPSYPHREAAERITLRQLLQHRGGIGDWDGRRMGRVSPGEAAATMTDPPGESGSAFAYSNAGYVLLAAAAEAASGMEFDQLIERLVFKRAGMTRSGLWPVTAIVPDRATGYLRLEDDPLGFGPRFSNHQFLGAGADGSGGGYSTVDDLLAFHRALADGKLLSTATVRMMIEDAVEFAGAPRPSHYGLGLRLADCAGIPTIGHGGGGPNSGVSSTSYMSRDGEWTVIVLSNYDPPAAEDLALDLCELVHRK